MNDELYLEHVLMSAHESLSAFDIALDPHDPAPILNALRDARSTNNLALILGAGVSVDSGIGSWVKLVDNAAGMLLGSKHHELLSALNSSSNSAARRIRFCESMAGVKTAFRAYLVKALYKDYDGSQRNQILEAICDLICGTDGGQKIQTVLSYNFDSLLDDMLEQSVPDKIEKVVSIYSEELYRKHYNSNSVLILHPHGFLPRGRPFGELAKNPIVFSEDDYHDHFIDYAYWANAAQLELFGRATCLFIGLSFECPNMRRLLDCSRRNGRALHQRVAIMRLPDEPNSKAKKLILQNDLAAFDVVPIWVQSHRDIPSIIRMITA